MSSPPSDLLERYKAANQAHVFDHWSTLSAAEQTQLVASLSAIDVDEVARVLASARAAAAQASDATTLSPFENVVRLEDASDAQRATWRRAGLDAVARGTVVALILAGGQGTRLGHAAPKGTYVLPALPSGKCLFALHVERLLRLRALAQEETAVSAAPLVPLWIMTSDATDAATRRAFADAAYFGYDATRVHFFRQGTFPCLTDDGRLIMAASGVDVLRAPNGNGGVYAAAAAAGALEQWAAAGVRVVAQTGVDNVLGTPVDPVLVGAHLSATSPPDVTLLTVRKSAPTERVGVLARRAGARGVCVVEYSEISEAMSTARDTAGRLVYGAANLCIAVYSREFFAAAAASSQLPWHVATKRLDGARAPTAVIERGLKLEQFIFDVYAEARGAMALEVRRDDAFAPLKNAPGAAADSPMHCVRALSARAKRWLGGRVDDEGVPEDEAIVEISPLRSLAGENLSKETFKKVQFPLLIE